VSRKKLKTPIVPTMTAKEPKGPSAAVVAAVKEKPVVASEDKLDRLRVLVGAARDIQMMVTQKEEEIDALKARLTKARTLDIPQFMEDNGIPAITLGAEGNAPAVECVRVPFYQANIKTDWEPQRRDAAFAYLEKIGEGDLIKTTITYFFPKEDQGATGDFIEKVSKLKIVKKVGKAKKGAKQKVEAVRVPTPVIERGVPWNSLTAWLKRKVENDKFVPDLEKIGAFVGTVADIKPLKEKK